MTGLEKMKNQILEEAKKAAEAKMVAAETQAEEIISQARQDAEKLKDSILQKSKVEEEKYKERISSSVDLQKRTRILAAKQAIIADILEKAYASLSTMETEEYFSMLTKMLEKYVLAEEGELFLSAKDLERMPSGFEKEVKQIAAAKGGSLVISKEGKKIENGFVLDYGGIEENCTLRAIFDAKRDELSDKVNRLLFA